MGVKCFLVTPVYDSGTKFLGYVWDKEHHIGSPVHRRVDNGEWIVGYQPGMMWVAYESRWDDALQGQVYVGERLYNVPGPDEKNLVVILPDGSEWHVDGNASNCTWKDQKHRCWERNGVPPNISVGKGPPCSDGQGSIKTLTYHGHLNNGEFTENMP